MHLGLTLCYLDRPLGETDKNTTELHYPCWLDLAPFAINTAIVLVLAFIRHEAKLTSVMDTHQTTYSESVPAVCVG